MTVTMAMVVMLFGGSCLSVGDPFSAKVVLEINGGGTLSKMTW